MLAPTRVLDQKKEPQAFFLGAFEFRFRCDWSVGELEQLDKYDVMIVGIQ
jgi:hypothetical protein